jgi:hypothetical protein
LPDRKPFFSGLHGTSAMAWSWANGATSLSTVRASSEYSTCSATSGVQPFSSAVVCACAATHAGVLENPTYRILPAPTRSSSVRSVSSIGVLRSQLCNQYRSR